MRHQSRSLLWFSPFRSLLIAGLSAFLFAAFLFSAVPAWCQDDPNTEQGIQAWASVHGGDIDSVNLDNGGLYVHVPVVSYPQRGGVLNLSFSAVYNSKNWTVKQFGVIPVQYLQWFYSGTGLGLVRDGSVNFGTKGCKTCSHTGHEAGWTVATTSDGSLHYVASIVGQAGSETLDGTDIRLLDILTQTYLDRDGAKHGQVYSSGQFANVRDEDTNGNQISDLTSGYEDTLGRSIPYPPLSTSSAVGFCPAGTSTASVWNLPSVNGGTAPIQLCYTNLTLQSTFGISGIREGSVSTRPFLTSVVLPNNTEWSFKYDNFGDVIEIDYPSGGIIKYTWTFVEAPSCPNNFTPGSRRIATRSVDASDGSGPKTWSYNWNATVGGTPARVVTDPSGNDAAHFFHTFGAYCTNAEIQTRVFQGAYASNNLLRTLDRQYIATANPYIFYTQDGSVGGIFPTTVTTTLDNGKVMQDAKTDDLAFQYYDSNFPSGGNYQGTYGTVVQQTTSDYGQGAPGATLVTNSTSYIGQSNPSYQANNLVLLPSSVTVAVGGTTRAYTTYGYDESSPMSSGISTQHDPTPPAGNFRGNLTSEHRQLLNGSAVSTATCPVSVSSGGYLVSTTTYFDTGTPKVSTDPCNHTTMFAYSPTYVGAYLTSMTNALNQATTYTYDFNTGQQASVTDPNKQTTSYTYEEMWRLASTSYPDGGQTFLYYSDFPPSPTVDIYRKLSVSGQYATSVKLMDGLQRVTDTQLYSDPEGTDYNFSVYDGLGRVFKKYNPTRCNQPTSNCGESTWGYTTFTYDALGRTTLVTQPDGSKVSTSYTGNCTTVTDEAGKNRQSCADGLGRMTTVTENPGGLNYLTTYTYDVLNNLTNVLQVGSRPRTFMYDSLSRLTSATNPESGRIAYTYDADGNVITKTAPAPNQIGSATVTTTYSYDIGNRITQKSYSDGTTPSAFFTYDASSAWGVGLTNTVGRLTEEWSGTSCCASTGAEIFSYDPMGRILLNTQFTATNNTYSPLNYSYDLLGDTLTATDGEGVTISYQYSTAPRVTAVTSSLVNATHPATLASGLLYAPNGSTSQITYGNGLTASSVYNPRFQPCRSNVNSSGAVFSSLSACGSTSMPAGNVLDLQNSWNAGSADSGNLVGAAAAGAQTYNRTYAYDQLNRLSGMSGTGGLCTGLNWSYDAWGNRTSQTQVSGTCYQQPTTTITASNQISGDTYDAAGNLTSQPGATYIYDAENRLTSTNSGAATYTYDASGRRVQKTVSGAHREYLYDTLGNVVSEVTSAGWQVGHAYLVGRMIAEYDNGTTYFVTGDHLGSSRLLTTLTGGVQDCNGFYPYGEQDMGICASNNTTTLKFTGKERDAESNLDNFLVRYYGSSLGRFMSADPGNVAGDLDESDNPQSWNAYSYTHNNPLNAVDPNGLDCVYVSGNWLSVGRGDCQSDYGSGIYVNGTIDTKSFTYNSQTKTLGFNYKSYDTNALGAEAIKGVGQSSGVSDEDRLNALALAGSMAQQGIQAGSLFMAKNAALAVGGRLIGLGVEAALAARAARAAKVAEAAAEAAEVSNVLAKAASVVGNQAVKVASKGVAEAAAKEFLGPGAEQITDRATGAFTGWISEDGTRVVIDTHADQVGEHMNFINKVTGGNLHVRW